MGYNVEELGIKDKRGRASAKLKRFIIKILLVLADFITITVLFGIVVVWSVKRLVKKIKARFVKLPKR